MPANRTWWGGVSGNWSTAGNWLEAAVPVAGDSVIVPPGAGAINAGLDQSAVTLASVRFEDGYTSAVGTYVDGVATYLQLSITNTTGVFDYAGRGQAYINLGSSAIAPIVKNSANAGNGLYGLYLKGSALTTVTVYDGKVGIAALSGETATAATVYTVNSTAQVEVGSGVSLTTFTQLGGTNILKASATTANIDGGTLTTLLAAAFTNMNAYGGTVNSNAAGTIATLNVRDATANFLGSGTPRTVSALKLSPGGVVYIDRAVVTVTAWSAPDLPTKIIASRV